MLVRNILKLVYLKTFHLNKEFYFLNFMKKNERSNAWNVIYEGINTKLKIEMEKW
jgi:hypothetical protein